LAGNLKPLAGGPRAQAAEAGDGGGAACLRLGFLAEALQQFGDDASRNRARIEIALAKAAAHHLQALGLPLRFDALGDDLHAEAVGDPDQRLDDHAAPGAAFDAADEGAVDLDDVDREIQQMGQRGEAGAEIVERDENAPLAQRSMVRATLSLRPPMKTCSVISTTRCSSGTMEALEGPC
jgi:hypothetical protein